MCVCVCLSAWQLELPFWFANFSISHFPFESTKSTKCNTANASLVSFRSCILIIYFGKLFISRLSICPQPPHLISLSCQTIRHSPTLSTYCLAINADLYYFPLFLCFSLSLCTLLLCFVTQLLRLIFEKMLTPFPFPQCRPERQSRSYVCTWEMHVLLFLLTHLYLYMYICMCLLMYVDVYVHTTK